MSAVENSEVIRELCEAYNRHDLPAMIELCTDDCLAVCPMLVRSPKHVWARQLSEAMAGFPDGQVRVLNLIAQWDQVALELEWQATQKGEYRGQAPAGRTLDLRCVCIFELADTRIRRATLYPDTTLCDLPIHGGPAARTGGA